MSEFVEVLGHGDKGLKTGGFEVIKRQAPFLSGVGHFLYRRIESLWGLPARPAPAHARWRLPTHDARTTHATQRNP